MCEYCEPDKAVPDETKFFRELNTELTERMRCLIEALRDTQGIDVRWDETRKAWTIKPTKGNYPERDEGRDIETENTELRERCASLFRLANTMCRTGMRHCDDCPMNRSEPPCSLSLNFIAMRDLGIDVTPWDVEENRTPNE